MRKGTEEGGGSIGARHMRERGGGRVNRRVTYPLVYQRALVVDHSRALGNGAKPQHGKEQLRWRSGPEVGICSRSVHRADPHAERQASARAVGAVLEAGRETA